MRKKRYWSKHWTNESEKDHEALPDHLGIGVVEERFQSGLYIYLSLATEGRTIYVVLGKYAQPKPNGVLFYVADWTTQALNPTTTYHDHLLSAIAKIHQIKERFDERLKKEKASC